MNTHEAPQMSTLFVQTRSGAQLTLVAEPSQTLLEALRAGGVEEVEALCGGSCSCATCHVIVDPEFAGRLAPIGDDEDALLDSSDYRAPTSRLSCQIVFRDELDGLRVTIAPKE